MGHGATAGVLAEHHPVAGDADRSGRHDLVGERVRKYTVLMNAGLVSKGIAADDGLVRRGSEADDRGEQLAHGVEVIHDDVALNGIAVGANMKSCGNLFESGVTGA